MKKLLTICFAVICLFIIGNDVQALSYGSGWTRRIALNIDPAKVPGTDDLTSYPALLTEANFDSEIFTLAKSDGCDLRFSSDIDGATEIAFEKVTFATTTSSLEYHVKVPTVSYNATTTIYAWYGNSSASCYNATDTYGRNAVWTDYELVMHMNDLTSTTLLDSTGNGHTATDSGTSNVEGAGKIGKSQVFNGNSQYEFGTITEFAGINKLYTSFWGKRTSGTNNIAQAFSSTGAQGNNGNLISYGYETTSAYNTYNTFFAADTYEHIVQVYDGTQSTNYTRLRVWKNGSEVSASGSSGTIVAALKNPALPSYISYTTARWIGEIDEVRAAILNFSEARTQTEYNNQNAPATFILEGVPQAVSLSYKTDWLYKEEIQINPAYVATTSSETNFPVLITEANVSSTFFDHSKSDGCDARFSADVNGATEIPLELVSITKGAASTTEMYVKVPTLSGTATTSIWIWYGNAGATCYRDTDTYGAQNVWDTHYKAVLHLKDLTTTTVKDSTRNGNNGTKASADNPNTDTGKIGSAQYFSGSLTDYLRLPDNTFDALSSGSIQAWFKTYDATNYHLIGAGASDGTTPNLIFGWLAASARTYWQHYGTPADAYTTTNTIASNTWGHKCWKSSGSAWSGYINGGSAETLIQLGGSNSGKWFDDVSTGTTYYYIGRTTYAGYYLKGWIDEVRISTNEFTAEWNTTDYNNQNSPATFAVEQGEQPANPTTATISTWSQMIIIEEE